MSKDKLSVRVYNIEQIKPVQAFVRGRDVVLFEQHNQTTVTSILNLAATAKAVNYLRPEKLGFSDARLERKLVEACRQLHQRDDVLQPRLLNKVVLNQVATLNQLLPSYQTTPAFDMTPIGGVAVLLCRLPFSPNKDERDPDTQREIDRTIAIWESLNEVYPENERRNLLMLFV